MTKYTVKYTSQFKKDYKLVVKQHRDTSLLNSVISMLANGEALPEKYHDHALSGKWVNHRECHIQPDWLLIYYYDDDTLVLTLSRTGSHSTLLGK